MNHQQFISHDKSILIAPAGYGKTNFIMESFEAYEKVNNCTQTHTHAGVASIKAKFQKANIPAKKFHIETITGYAKQAQVSLLLYAKRHSTTGEHQGILSLSYQSRNNAVKKSNTQNGGPFELFRSFC